MDESRIIGCCTARTWALTAAILSMIRGVVVGALSIVDLNRDPDEHRGKPVSSKDVEKPEQREQIFETLIAVAAFDFVMGVALFIGVQRRASGLVMTWLIYTSVATILGTILYLVQNSAPKDVLRVIGTTMFTIILLTAVYIHWKEIRTSRVENGVIYRHDGVGAP